MKSSRRTVNWRSNTTPIRTLPKTPRCFSRVLNPFLNAELSQAYQVLSDPNERTWYDSHKSQILKADMTQEDYEMQETYGFNIWHFFTPQY
jgi:hypothetical protein